MPDSLGAEGNLIETFPNWFKPFKIKTTKKIGRRISAQFTKRDSDMEYSSIVG